MTYRLFIDDEREANLADDETMIIARTSAEAIMYMISLGCPSYISFDHDLGIDPKSNIEDTAFEVVKWMVDYDIEEFQSFIPKDFEFYVHSQNPVGKKKIENYLTQYLSLFPRS